MKIVVTGNMGCGKTSAVVAMVDTLRKLGQHYNVFDFDNAVAQLYQNANVQRELTNAFGTCVKAEVSDIVHFDSFAMERLTSITTPYLLTVIEEINKEVNVIFDIPLYFEFNDVMKLTPDAVICIAADRNEQVQRIKKRNGFSVEKINQILANLMPQREKATRSDYVIFNEQYNFANVIEFQQAVAEMITKICTQKE